MTLFRTKSLFLGVVTLLLCVQPAFAEDVEFSAFDWSQVLKVPPGTQYTAGSQILHFKSKDKHYSMNPDAALFVEKYLRRALPARSDAEVLRIASDAVTVEGAYLEMGVCTGKTINFLAALNPYQTIHGFDSFQGLPEDWVREDKIIPAGTFGYKFSQLPPVLHNVALYPGWFKDSLPKFVEHVLKKTPIALLHIDCDIYSATKETFAFLKGNIQEGTVIIFDELYNYPGCENHEWKAFREFLAETGWGARYLAYNVNHEQVAVKIFKRRKIPR